MLKYGTIILKEFHRKRLSFEEVFRLMARGKKHGAPLRWMLFLGLMAIPAIYLQMSFWAAGKQSASIHFVGLEEADAIVVQSGGQVMLVDTGTPEDEQLLLSSLDALGIDRIDLLVLTHPDKDHIGGAKTVLETYSVAKILMSSAKKGSQLEEDLLTQIDKEQIPVEYPEETDPVFSLGDCSVRIYAGEKDDYEQINNSSIALLITCGNRRVFLAADMENARMAEMIFDDPIECDVLKLPHHGEDEELSAAFLKTLDPDICIVTAPQAGVATTRMMQQLGCEVYYTAQGEVDLLIQKNLIERGQRKID
mgnify:FL=1